MQRKQTGILIRGYKFKKGGTQLKRKILSTLLVLVLMLSFSLVMAVPVAAAEIIVGDAYATIQEAVDAASPGDTITVVAGTYTEDVSVNKTLTLQGAQVGVDPRGGRAGDESEIVGVVVVTSDATDVVFDGFKFASPTRAFTPRGFNLGVESESSTIRNNIFVAEENAGHVPYGSYLTFQDVTNVLVEQNSFSGHLDSIQEPNVILVYGIVAGGTVTVQNNEMHDVGGGGGVGIMCDNANAVINITGNEMDNTGDGVWVWNGGGSVFDMLSITDNEIHDCSKIGVKVVAPVTGTVFVSGNDFQDNDIQVDTGGVLVVEEVLASNTFDRAVVVDHSGSSLLHMIWSSIQDAVDAAVAGDTVEVLEGTYRENVVISPDKDGLQLLGDGYEHSIITPVSGQPIKLPGWSMLDERPLDGVRIQGFRLVTADDSHAILVGSGTPDGSYYTTNLELDDIVIQEGSRGIGLNSVNGVTLTDVQLANVSGSPEAALELTGVFGLTFVDGSIWENDIGVRLQATGPGDIGEGYGVNGDIEIHSSSFCGNGIAIENLDSSVEIDATDNYWCHPSGPRHSPGEGDPVSDYVAFEPWLLELGGDTYDKTLPLKDGWTLFSVDKAVSDPVWVGEILLAYKHTPTGGFVPATAADLKPLTAIFVKTNGGGGVGFNYPEGGPAIDSKNLEAGWNLIGSPAGITSKALLAPLRYVTVGTQQIVGLTSLISPGEYNLSGVSFDKATLTDLQWMTLPDLAPFDGYWASMEAAEVFEAPY